MAINDEREMTTDLPSDPEDAGSDVDWRIAFLFATSDGRYLAATLDRAGANLPRDNDQDWHFQAEFRLGVHEPVPAAIDPEPLLWGIEARGFLVWPVQRPLPMDHGE